MSYGEKKHQTRRVRVGVWMVKVICFGAICFALLCLLLGVALLGKGMGFLGFNLGDYCIARFYTLSISMQKRTAQRRNRAKVSKRATRRHKPLDLYLLERISRP